MSKTFINREIESEVFRLSQFFPVLVITGPRQSGKTTLCKNLFGKYHYVNLENIALREQIALSPLDFLNQHSTGLIIDEAQQYPELFSYIQIIVDEKPESKIILTGSSNFSLMENVTQSLAGRAALLTLLPFGLHEISKHEDTDTLLFNGGYPAVWANNVPVQDVAQNYYNTYIERDVRQILNIKDMVKFQSFMRLCAGRIGSEMKASTLANEVGVSVHTIQEWFSVLEASYILFRLPPFYGNLGKRLVKTPKMYFCDTGLVCFLIGIENKDQLATHPLRGAIFENYVVLEALKSRYNRGKLSNFFFYRDQSQREVDLIQDFGSYTHAYEVKSARMFHADFLKNLHYLKKLLGNKLTRTQVIYDGGQDIISEENGMLNFRNFKID